MPAAYAMALERFTSAVAPIFQRVIAIATAVNWTLWAYAVGLVRPTKMPTAFAMTPTIASVNWMLAAFATDQVRSMIAVVKKCQKAIAIATAMSLTPLESAEELA